MGYWGIGIYSDDIACDVRDYYMDCLKEKMDKKHATNKTLDYFKECIGTEDEAALWLGLAMIQWKKGRLMEDVKEQAIKYIELGPDVNRWRPGTADYKKRKEVLQKLKNTLMSPMPEAKEVRKKTRDWICPWKVGDILQYKLTDERLIEKYPNKKYVGKYVLLRLVSIYTHKSHGTYLEDACFGIFSWIGDSVPNIDAVKDMDYVVCNEAFDDGILLKFPEERVFWADFSKKQIKQHEIVKIGEDNEFKIKLPEFFIGYERVTSYGPAYDLKIVNALEKGISSSSQRKVPRGCMS